jgi:modulator of FtsH protease
VAYDPSEWTDLFVAAAGASAALAGLIFVAVSINVEAILKLRGVPERALQALLQLIVVVIVSLLALAPGDSTTALGIESTAIGIAVLLFSLKLVAVSEFAQRSWHASRVVTVLLGTMPFVLGGISLIATSGGGLYWLLAGIVLATMGSVANAWVLLVEILR